MHAGLAYWQRSVAKTEAALAQRNFNAAQETKNSVVFDLASGLRDVEGMRVETVRRILCAPKGGRRTRVADRERYRDPP